MITVKSVIEMVSTEYSGTSTNNNLSTVATFFVLANSPYNDSCLNLSIMPMAPKVCPKLPK